MDEMKMENVYVNSEKEMICPFCNECLMDVNYDDVLECSHTLFITTDFGFQKWRKDFDYLVDEKYESYIDYDSYTDDLPISGFRYKMNYNNGSVKYVIYGFVQNTIL